MSDSFSAPVVKPSHPSASVSMISCVTLLSKDKSSRFHKLEAFFIPRFERYETLRPAIHSSSYPTTDRLHHYGRYGGDA